MSCLLCFGVECDENLISVASVESRRQNIPFILYTHFRFCFQAEPIEGYVCQKCWVKVSVFHEFYTHIECMHRSNETIFVESIIDDVKPSVDSDSDNWDFDFPPEEVSIDEKLRRKRGRPRKVSTKIEIESDSADHFNDNIDLNQITAIVGSMVDGKIVPENAEITVENQQATNADGDRNRKRGRPRKDEIIVKREEHNICVSCNIDFPTPSALYRHTKQKHEVAAFKCKYFKCVESYATREELDTHHRTQHKKVQCTRCNKLILVKQIDHHMRAKHAPGDPVICDICGKPFANLFLYRSHHRSAHETEVIVRLQCDICKQSYKNKAILARHLREHMHGPQICPICGHVSPNRRALAKHKEIHIPELKDRYKCFVCGKGFRDRIKLKEHSHIHTGSAGTHHCKMCGKVFRFNSSFSLHKKTMHPKPATEFKPDPAVMQTFTE